MQEQLSGTDPGGSTRRGRSERAEGPDREPRRGPEYPGAFEVRLAAVVIAFALCGAVLLLAF